MNITFNTILRGLFEEHDADQIIITCCYTMLSAMRREWSRCKAHSNSKLLLEESEQHALILAKAASDGLPDEEDASSEYLAVKAALNWVIFNIDTFWV